MLLGSHYSKMELRYSLVVAQFPTFAGPQIFGHVYIPGSSTHAVKGAVKSYSPFHQFQFLNEELWKAFFTAEP